MAGSEMFPRGDSRETSTSPSGGTAIPPEILTGMGQTEATDYTGLLRVYQSGQDSYMAETRDSGEKPFYHVWQ